MAVSWSKRGRAENEGGTVHHFDLRAAQQVRIKPPKVLGRAAASNKRSSLTVLSRIVLSSLGIRQHGRRRRRRRLPASRSLLRVSGSPPSAPLVFHTRPRTAVSLASSLLPGPLSLPPALAQAFFSSPASQPLSLLSVVPLLLPVRIVLPPFYLRTL
jgi:hypothetical protein